MFEPLPIDAHFSDCFEPFEEAQVSEVQCGPEVSSLSAECGGMLQPIKNKFLHAYHRTNYLNHLLSECDLPETERKRLLDERARIQSAIFALEDACLPFGFLVEVVETDETNTAWAKALKFTHPTPAEFEQKEQIQPSSSSFDLLITIPETTAGDRAVAQGASVAPEEAGPEQIILSARLSPGDILMLTAAVREVAETCPDRFEMDVRTPCDALWEHNPYLTPLDEHDPRVRTIDCEYPLVHQSNQRPYHFIHGYIKFLSKELGIDIEPTLFKGDVHLSDKEKSTSFIQPEDNPEGLPVWIISAGGKFDFTIKWWHRRRYQQVVDAFRGRILFVQVGEEGHYHPKLNHTLDLRGKTTLRDMVHLMHWADGVVCGVTFHMHLAAAVPLRPRQQARPAVVIAGGREPPHWEAYPTHQYLHTVGMLSCCAQGGCWKARTLPLGDGDVKDESQNLCVDVVGGLPRCMHSITANQVCQQVELAHSFTLQHENNNQKESYGR